MSDKANVWLIALVAALIGVIIGMMMNGREVVAQGDGSAAHIVALAGVQEGNYQPIYIVDANEQILLVYEYGLGKSGLEFVASRTFKYDKLADEFDIRLRNGRSMSVDEMRKYKGKKRGRR